MFAKIFRSMFQGSMYGNPDGIITFIVMLVLAERHGEVDMTPEAIAAITSIPLNTIQAGIEFLSRPDPESRTPGESGKRIVLLDDHRKWGWKITNYEHYRQIRNEEERREYQAQWARNARAARKELSTDVDTPSSTRRQASTKSTNADADADADADARLNPKTVKAAKTPPIWFEDFKSLYPPRSGDPNWAGALRAANARIQEGCSADEILSGVRRYASFIQVTGKAGTEFVQQASRFLGPSKGFLLPWYPPPKAEDPMQRLRRINGLTGESRGTTFDIESSGVVGAIGRDVRD